MRASGSNITCSVQDALSPALVPKPLEFAHDILHHRGTACCTIQESNHLHPQLHHIPVQQIAQIRALLGVHRR